MSRAAAPATSETRKPRIGGQGALTLALLGALLVTTMLAVTPAIDGAFTFDEEAGVAANRAIHPGAPLSAALAYRFSPDQARPLFFLLLWADARLHGPAPRGFRVTNLVLHLLCGIVVFVLLRRAALRCVPAGAPAAIAEGAALAGAALFLLHPLQSESVIYVWGRSGVLATLLALLALRVAPVGGAAPGDGGAAGASWHRAWSWMGSWVLLALALATKEEAMILPLVALIWWHFVERRPFRPALASAARLAVPVAVFVALRIVLLGAAGRQLHVRSVPENILGQGVVNLKMVALTLCPTGLSIDHAARVPPAPTGLAAVALCLALVVAGLFGALRLRAPALRAACAGAILYAAGTLLYWLVPLPDLMSERRAYLPLFGAALTLTALLTEAAGRRWQRPILSGAPWRGVALTVVAPLLIAAFLAPALRARARLWADPALLWEEASRSAPETARPHINLGVIAADRGDLDGAAARFDRAIHLEPRNPEALYNRGRLRLERGDIEGAEADLRASVAADPTVPRARINLGVALIRRGSLPGAEEQLRAALAIDAGEPRALTNLAEVLRATGRAAEAPPLYRAALVSDPAYAHAAARLGVALEEAGDSAGALSAYREYLERRPSSDTDTAAVRARIAILEAGLAAPGSIR